MEVGPLFSFPDMEFLVWMTDGWHLACSHKRDDVVANVIGLGTSTRS